MGKVVVVTSGKGGVGKTTSTAALGAALATFGHNVVVVSFDPRQEEFARVLWRRRRRAVCVAILCGDPLDAADRLRCEIQEVIVEREARIQPATRGVDIFHLVIDGQRVERQMRFHRAAMRLRFQHGDHHIDRQLVAAIDPGMGRHDRHRRCRSSMATRRSGDKRRKSFQYAANGVAGPS